MLRGKFTVVKCHNVYTLLSNGWGVGGSVCIQKEPREQKCSNVEKVNNYEDDDG